MRIAQRARSLVFFIGMLACAGPRAAVHDAVTARDVPRALGAYDEFREVDGSDVNLLADVAALLLELEALSDDAARSAAAIAQLRLAGTAGAPALDHVAHSEGVSVARGRALQTLARRGDAEARAYLYSMLDEDDPAIVAIAIEAVDPVDESDRLLRYLSDTDPDVRHAASLQLARVPESVPVLHALSDVARVDPDAAVRSAAVRALGGFGAVAISGPINPLETR